MLLFVVIATRTMTLLTSLLHYNKSLHKVGGVCEIRCFANRFSSINLLLIDYHHFAQKCFVNAVLSIDG